MTTKKRVSDSSLSRINAQLMRAELIQKEPGHDDNDRHRVYALTPRGERVARMLTAITQALEELQADPEAGLNRRTPRQRRHAEPDVDQDPGLTTAER